jgi:hypothetical protein
MRAWPRLAAGVAVWLTAWVAYAQEPGQPAPDIPLSRERGRGDERSLLEVHRNRIIVIIYWSSTSSHSIEVLKKANELYRQYAPRGVGFVAWSRDKMEKIEEVFSEHEIVIPRRISASPEGRFLFASPPSAYIIDKYHRIAYARFDPSEDLEERIQAVLRRTPTANATPERLEANLARVGQLAQAGDFPRAYTLARELEEVLRGVDETRSEQVESLLTQLQTGAQRMLGNAQQDVRARNYEAAAQQLAALSVRLEGVQQDGDGRRRDGARRTERSRPRGGRRDRRRPAGEEQAERVMTYIEIREAVETEIGQLQGDAYTKRIIAKAVDNARGELECERAEELLAAQQFTEAREAYRNVVERYPDTAAAERAQQSLDRLATDPDLRAAMKKVQAAEQAERWYDIGSRFARSELFDMAREYLEKVIQEYPASTAAEQARARLKELPAAEERAARRRAAREAARSSMVPVEEEGEQP